MGWGNPDTGGGGGGRQTFTPPESPFANIAARDAWASANLSSLFNSTTRVTEVLADGDLYRWSGDNIPTSYDANQWLIANNVLDAGEVKTLYESNPDTNAFTDSDNTASQSLQGGTAGTIPMFTASGVQDSIATQPDNSGVVFDGEIRTTKDTVRVGESLALSEDGADIKATNMLENIEALPLRTILNADGTTGGNFAVRRTDRQTAILQGNDTQTQDGDYSFHAPITATRIAKAIIVRFAQAATGIRLTLRNADNVDDLDGNIIFQSHTDAEWNAGAGFSVPATGDFTINIPNSAKFIQNNFVYVTVEQNTQGTGTLSIRGFNTTIGPISGFFPYLAQTFVLESLDSVALKDDLRPQVVEITADLTINSANVDTYRDRILQYNGSSNITITIAATDTFDELDSFSVWNNTSSNSRVTITQTGGQVNGRNNYRVRPNDFAEFTYDGTSDWFVRRQSFSLSSAQSDWNETDTESVSFIRNKPTTLTPSPTEARFTRFEFQSQPTSVEAGTTISGLKTFLIRVERPDLLTGTLTIRQGSTVLTQGILQPTVTSAGVPINSATLTNAGDTVVFTIEGTLTAGGTITRTITVRATAPHELAYYGIRPTDDFSSVALSELSSTDITANNSFDVTGAFANGSFVGILVPTNMDLNRITTLATPVTSSFTRTENARTINSQTYILYTLQNNGGIDGQAAYTVEI